MPQLDAVLETALYVDDLDRAVRFYSGVLELKPLYQDSRLTAFSVGDRNVLLLFPRGASLETVHMPGGTIPPHDGHITRVETLGGKYLYAIKVHLSGETFDLCPADICRTGDGVALNGVCAVEAPKAGLRVDAYEPPPHIAHAVERILTAMGIDVGGVEYIVDDRDGELYFYDVNALSNFVADAPTVLGFEPHVRLVDYLIESASAQASARQAEVRHG